MKNIYRVLSLLIAFTMVSLSLVACGGETEISSDTSAPQTLESTPIETDAPESTVTPPTETVESGEGSADSETNTETPASETTSDTTETTELFDYATADYAAYITLDRSVYEGKTFSVPYSQTVTDEDFNTALADILRQYGTAVTVVDQAAVLGDTVKIYYKGVQVGENGVETAFDGGTYMAFGTPYSLTLGSGSFIDGFEDGLIGVVPKNTYLCTTEPSYVVWADDHAHMKVTGTYRESADDPFKTVTSGIDQNGSLTAELVSMKECPYGQAFADALVGVAHAGDTVEFSAPYDADDDGAEEMVSFSVEVVDILRLNAHEIQATFPDPYSQSPELAGQTVKFYVWVEAIERTTPAEIDDAFFEKIGFKTTEVDKTAAFYKELRRDMQEQLDVANVNAVLSPLWQLILDEAQVKQYPASEVESYVASIKAEAEYYMSYYQYMGIQFDDLADFVCQSYGITGEEAENFDVETFFREEAELSVKSRMLAFHLVREYGLTVSEEILQENVLAFLEEQVRSAAEQGETYTVESMAEYFVKNYGEGYVESYIEESLLSDKLNETLFEKIVVAYGVTDE